jgi:hypothetical protein
MISVSVTPLARFIIAMTSAFLLVPSDFGLPAAFFAGRFLGGLAPNLWLRRVGRRLADVLRYRLCSLVSP